MTDPAMSSQLQSALYKLRKYGDVLRCDDGFYRYPGKYWSISPGEMATLVRLGLARVDRVGESSFARAVARR